MFITFLCICVLFSCVSSHSGGLHSGSIEAECLAFFQREPIWVPVVLEQESSPSTIPPNRLIRLARHHVIPVRTLRDFFDTAVRTNHEGNVELTGLMNLMGYLATNALNQYTGVGDLDNFIRRDLEEMRNLQTLYIDQEPDLNDPSVEILFSSQFLVRSMYQWMPANIFIGPDPQLRSDDPGDSFELNSRYIIGEEDYQRLVTINRMMISYVETHERGTYNEVIELLSEISQGRTTPYPFNVAQWIYDPSTRKYHINTNPNNRKKRQNTAVTFIDSDPNCLKPLETIKRTIEGDNLKILSLAVDRAIKHNGFYSKDYSSWKAWYADSSWVIGIFADGLSMAGKQILYNAYGYTFNDKSFAVGIVGTDANGQKDNWVNLAHDFRDTTDVKEYAGQAFFDKNGRPVAIVITSLQWAEFGSGWSFIYDNGKWEYERTDSWDESRFAGHTLCLDADALSIEQQPANLPNGAASSTVLFQQHRDKSFVCCTWFSDAYNHLADRRWGASIRYSWTKGFYFYEYLYETLPLPSY